MQFTHFGAGLMIQEGNLQNKKIRNLSADPRLSEHETNAIMSGS